MNYLLFKSNEIIGIYTHIDNILHFIYHNIKILIYCNVNKINYFNDYNILQYKNTLLINKYIFDINSLLFIDLKKEKYYTSNLILKDTYNNIKNKIYDMNNNNETELNVHLQVDPIFINDLINKKKNIINDENNNTEYKWIIHNEQNNIKNSEEKSSDFNTKIKKLDDLKNKLENEYNDMIILKTNFELKEKKYQDEKQNIDIFKLKLKNHHDKMEELKRKFYTDKNLYFVIKNEINNNLRDKNNIPLLFKTYNIFNELENKNILNTSIELTFYINEINKISQDNDYVYFNTINNNSESEYSNEIDSEDN